MARPRPSRVSSGRVMRELRAAARKGDRAALTLAVEHMRILALSPRYWEKYLSLLGNPLARLVDLLVIKQGERIAQQKGWRLAGRRRIIKLEGAAAAPSKPPHSREVRQKTAPAKPPRSRGGRHQSPRQSRGSKRRPSTARRGAPANGGDQQLLFDMPPRA